LATLFNQVAFGAACRIDRAGRVARAWPRRLSTEQSARHDSAMARKRIDARRSPGKRARVRLAAPPWRTSRPFSRHSLPSPSRFTHNRRIRPAVPARVTCRRWHAVVALVTIDGMRGDYLTNADAYQLRIPNLRRLMHEGSYSPRTLSVFPTLTGTAHTALVTGTGAMKHGILCWDCSCPTPTASQSSECSSGRRARSPSRT